jgi:hypothetical protein
MFAFVMCFLLFEETSEHRRSVVCTSAAMCAWMPLARTDRLFCDIRGAWGRVATTARSISALETRPWKSSSLAWPIAECVGASPAGRKWLGGAL